MSRPATATDTPPRDEPDALERLRSMGGRLTHARRELVRLFFALDGAVTVEDLIVRLPTLDPATLYRTVRVLEQAGIVEHTHLGHGAARYKRAGADLASLVCERCGGTTDIAKSVFGPLVAQIRAASGFEIDLHHFALSGTCAACHFQVPGTMDGVAT